MLYAILSRASAVLGDVATHRKASELALQWAEHVPAPLAMGIRLQLARGALVLRNVQETRTWAREVVSHRDEFPLLAWEASRLLALVDGSVPPPPASFIENLRPAAAEALDSRPI